MATEILQETLINHPLFNGPVKFWKISNKISTIMLPPTAAINTRWFALQTALDLSNKTTPSNRPQKGPFAGLVTLLLIPKESFWTALQQTVGHIAGENDYTAIKEQCVKIMNVLNPNPRYCPEGEKDCTTIKEQCVKIMNILKPNLQDCLEGEYATILKYYGLYNWLGNQSQKYETLILNHIASFLEKTDSVSNQPKVQVVLKPEPRPINYYRVLNNGQVETERTKATLNNNAFRKRKLVPNQIKNPEEAPKNPRRPFNPQGVDKVIVRENNPVLSDQETRASKILSPKQLSVPNSLTGAEMNAVLAIITLSPTTPPPGDHK
jgi:hypothetical protein